MLLVPALVIALPAGYFVIQNWLKSYAYHIDISPFYYVAALLCILIISTGTITYHTIKASNQNPSDTLRDE